MVSPRCQLIPRSNAGTQSAISIFADGQSSLEMVDPFRLKGGGGLILKQAEVQVLKMLWRCGVVAVAQANEHFGLHGNRLHLLRKENFVKQAHGVLYLSEAGVSYCQSSLQMTNRYRTSVRQLGHDMKLAGGYLALPVSTRETWKTEYDLYYEYRDDPRFKKLRDEILAMNQQFVAVPDAAVWSETDAGFLAFEALTPNYALKSIEQKKRFAALFLKGIKLF